MRHLEAVGRASAVGTPLRTVRYVNDIVLDYLWELANDGPALSGEEKKARDAARFLFDYADVGARY